MSETVLSIVALGMFVWHVAKVIHIGGIFAPFRRRLSKLCKKHVCFEILHELFDCRLCLNSQLAIWTTWAMILIFRSSIAVPLPVAFVIGPFVVASIAEILRITEGIYVHIKHVD